MFVVVVVVVVVVVCLFLQKDNIPGIPLYSPKVTLEENSEKVILTYVGKKPSKTRLTSQR